MDNYENSEFQQDLTHSAPQPEPQSEQTQAQPQQAQPQQAQPQQAQPQVQAQYQPYQYTTYTVPPYSQIPPQQSNPYTPGWQPQQSYAPQPAPAKKKKSRKAWKTILASILIVALVASGCGVTAWSVNHYWEKQNKENQQVLGILNQKIQDLQQQVEDNSYTGQGNSASGSPSATGDGLTPGQVYAKNKKCVVAISNQSTTNIFGQVSETASSGSGFIISEDGYVVTNYHVIEGATKLTVITYESKEYTAKVVGYDSSNDLAVLKIEATDLPAATLGSSDKLIIGDMVAAIGNPLGELTNSMTVGYVSAKDRSVSTDGTVINMLQTDAAINSGNSGGPLFNMKGEVVGITTAKYSGTSGSGATIEGIGFAIPIDDIAQKIKDLIEFGYVTGPYLGVGVLDVDSSLTSFGVPNGAVVKELYDGYCAKAAGVQVNDIIIALGSYKVDSINGLSKALRNFKAGDATTITVWRSGTQVTLDITLSDRPRENSSQTSAPDNNSSSVPEGGSFEDWRDHFFGDQG